MRHSNNRKHHTSIFEQVRLAASQYAWINLISNKSPNDSENSCELPGDIIEKSRIHVDFGILLVNYWSEYM